MVYFLCWFVEQYQFGFYCECCCDFECVFVVVGQFDGWYVCEIGEVDLCEQVYCVIVELFQCVFVVLEMKFGVECVLQVDVYVLQCGEVWEYG